MTLVDLLLDMLGWIVPGDAVDGYTTSLRDDVRTDDERWQDAGCDEAASEEYYNGE